MYPDNALPEFYPLWLIQDAWESCRTIEEAHAYCAPRFKELKHWDIGPEAGRAFLLGKGFQG